MNIADINIKRAGEFFIYSIWIQNQMTDLIILKNNPDIIDEFCSSPKIIPHKMSASRTLYWEKYFAQIKTEFIELFSNQLDEENIKDLNAIYHIRNAIAHSHISLGRDYLLYRPARGERQENDIRQSLEIPPREGAANPTILKLSFNDDNEYLKDFNRIKRLDEICFERIASELNIPHSRIR